VTVVETFFSVDVLEMERATAFYAQTFGGTIMFASPQWTSIRIAGVRVALALATNGPPRRIGLHFAVDDLSAACGDVDRAGGRIVTAPTEVAPSVVIAEVADREGNTFTLTQR
jgi:predicted enzyme related to lactoylglutathione lyase